MVQPAGLDGGAELEQPRLVGRKIEPRAPVVSEHPHVVNRRDALGRNALPRPDPVEELDARRGERVNPRIPFGNRCGRLALDQGDSLPAVGKRRGQARAYEPAADDGNVEIHAWIVLVSALFLDKYLMQNG